MAQQATWRDRAATWRSPFFSWRGSRIAGHGELRESVFLTAREQRPVALIEQQSAVATISVA